MTSIFLHPKRAAGPIAGHPWVFSGMIDRIEGTPALGDEVLIRLSGSGRTIGTGLYNPSSQIRARLYSLREERLDSTFLRNLIETAVNYRKSVLEISGKTTACRLICSEADSLSGLTVDQYGEYLVMQVTSGVLHRRLEEIVTTLQELLSPKGILLKSAGEMAKKEGMPAEERVPFGSIPNEPIEIEDQGLYFQVALRSGQKTGFFLDQRENRFVVGELARGKFVLDLYCYSGGFALHAARAGAKQVIGVDSSQGAIALAKQNALRNQLTNVSFVEDDALLYLQATKDQPYSMIILDPPKFAMSRDGKKNALRLYYRMNEAAIRLLAPDGILVSCSCSGRVSREEWLGLVSSVARRAKRNVEMIEYRGASRDHPVVPHIPESDYLKCLIARVC